MVVVSTPYMFYENLSLARKSRCTQILLKKKEKVDGNV